MSNLEAVSADFQRRPLVEPHQDLMSKVSFEDCHIDRLEIVGRYNKTMRIAGVPHPPLTEFWEKAD